MMQITIPAAPDGEITGASRALEFARTIAVNSQTSYELASVELRALKARRDALEAKRVEMKAPVLEAGRKIDDLFREPIAQIDEAMRVVKGTMITYQTEQERLAAEVRRKAEEEARRARIEAERKAREERERAEAEMRRQQQVAAEAQRAADEAARRAREAREANDRAAAEAAERERREAEERERRAKLNAEKAVEKGEQRAAAAMASAVEAAARPAPTVELPSAAGTSTRTLWRARVVDLRKLVEAVAAGRVPLTCLEPNMQVLNQAAKAQREELAKFYPGVEAVAEKSLATRDR